MVATPAYKVEMFPAMTLGSGVQIIELTDDQRSMFQKASGRVYDWYAKEKGTATVNLIRKAIKSVTMK